MSIGTYGELKTAVENWLARADLDSRIPEFIAGGLQRVNLDLQIAGGILDQEQRAYAATVATEESIALPTDYGAMRSIKLGTSPLEPRSYDELVDGYGDASGQPEKYAILAGEIFFRPIPDDAYTITINYSKRYTAFSADADTNYLLTSGANLLLYAALLDALPYLGNLAEAKGWAEGYTSSLNLMIRASRAGRWNHQPPELKSDRALVRARYSFNNC